MPAGRAALYLRVSTEEQTVENQRPELLALARMRGLDVVRTYEENVSAVKVRPAFDLMMADAHMGIFNVLIIWAIDRFGRSMLGNLEAILSLDRRNVTTISARESWLELGGPTRGLLIGVFSWVAEQERARLSERTTAGMKRAQAQGRHVGRPIAIRNASVARALAEGGHTQRAIAKQLGVSQAAVSRALARDAKGASPGGGDKPSKSGARPV